MRFLSFVVGVIETTYNGNIIILIKYEQTDKMKKSQETSILEFTTKFINSNFRIKVFGRDENGKKINTLVGVSGVLKLISV